MTHALPGDPIKTILARTRFSAGIEAKLRAEYGLDKPLPQQYLHYMSRLIQGDMGTSIQSGRPVVDDIRRTLPNTLQLTFAGMTIALVFGLVIGVSSALKENTAIDSFLIGVSQLGASLPIFWLGLLLMLVFSLYLHWFPVTEGTGIKGVILPALTLGWTYGAVLARLIRATMVDVLKEDYMVVAQAKGLRDRIVIGRHALRNALLPVLTMLGLQFGNMLAGSVVVEAVFDRPGIGRLLVDGILNMDFPVVQSTVLTTALIYLVANLIVDLAYPLLDPRIHTQ